jgi:hypothetical protein
MPAKPPNSADSRNDSGAEARAEPAPVSKANPERAATGPGLRWAIALFLLAGLLVLLFGGPPPN